MANPVSYLRQKLAVLARRETQDVAAQHQQTLPATSLGPDNPGGGGPVPLATQSFTTGYDGTNTIVPFMRGVSQWNEDYWTE